MIEPPVTVREEPEEPKPDVEERERPRPPVRLVLPGTLRPWNAIACEVTLGAIQHELEGQGHSPGPADGVWGPRTESAVRDFQRDRALPETGLADRITLSTLFSGDEPLPIQPVRGEDAPSRIGRPPARNRAVPFAVGLATGLLVATVPLRLRKRRSATL